VSASNPEPSASQEHRAIHTGTPPATLRAQELALLALLSLSKT
jgi:hypothetical protein